MDRIDLPGNIDGGARCEVKLAGRGVAFTQGSNSVRVTLAEPGDRLFAEVAIEGPKSAMRQLHSCLGSLLGGLPATGKLQLVVPAGHRITNLHADEDGMVTYEVVRHRPTVSAKCLVEGWAGPANFRLHRHKSGRLECLCCGEVIRHESNVVSWSRETFVETVRYGAHAGCLFEAANNLSHLGVCKLAHARDTLRKYGLVYDEALISEPYLPKVKEALAYLTATGHRAESLVAF